MCIRDSSRIQGLDQQIYVFPPPVIGRLETGAVFRVTPCILKSGTGIKIVIHVNPVYIVVADDLYRTVNDQLANLRQTGIQVIVAVRILHHPFRMLNRRIGGGLSLIHI